MAKRPITDELLNLAIESKLDAGVASERIRLLIEAFSGDETEGNRPQEIVGFMWIEDIAPSRRAEFLTTLLALSPEPKLAVADARHLDPRPAAFPISLLCKARAALGFGSA
jgi:hypothetical protein